jgi:hypothetical protein
VVGGVGGPLGPEGPATAIAPATRGIGGIPAFDSYIRVEDLMRATAQRH